MALGRNPRFGRAPNGESFAQLEAGISINFGTYFTDTTRVPVLGQQASRPNAAELTAARIKETRAGGPWG